MQNIPENKPSTGLSEEDTREIAAMLDWSALLLQQGWSEESQIIHLGGFIAAKGLMSEFLAYAQAAAKEENEDPAADQAACLDNIDVSRRASADAAYNAFDFGNGITPVDAGGWLYFSGACEWNRTVFCTDSEEPGSDSFTVNFTVVFETASSVVEEVWASLNGNLIGKSHLAG